MVIIRQKFGQKSPKNWSKITKILVFRRDQNFGPYNIEPELYIYQNESNEPDTRNNTSFKQKDHSKTSNALSSSRRYDYGWFSSESKARGNNTHIYLNESGDRVEVTCVTRIAEHGTGWDDIINTGRVYKYVESITNTK